MKKRTSISERGLTLLEAVVVIVVLMILAFFILPSLSGSHRSIRIVCINNLKQIGTAYRIWENDHGGYYPAMTSEVNGGMQDMLTNSDRCGSMAYLSYSIMQKELDQRTQVVICPSDNRRPNTDFFYGNANAPTLSPGVTNLGFANRGTFDNTNVSYFVGVGAADWDPLSILSGDRNLGDGGIVNPATGKIVREEQDQDFGISETDDARGADAIVGTNGIWLEAFTTGSKSGVDRGHAVGWSARIHSGGNKMGAGNILLGDGSAQLDDSAGLRANWLAHATNEGNFAKVDKLPTGKTAMRLLFP